MNKLRLALLLSYMAFSTYVFKVQNQLDTELNTEAQTGLETETEAEFDIGDILNQETEKKIPYEHYGCSKHDKCDKNHWCDKYDK